MALSKNQLKLIKSLSQKKYRQKHGLFIAEGVKVVQELMMSSFELHAIFATHSYTSEDLEDEIQRISEDELKKISNLKSPNKVLAIFQTKAVDNSLDDDNMILALDAINDPGNLGTIIRLCDWFGISQIVCSKDTVDCYNPKVVQSTMGSLSRVKIIYRDLVPFLSEASLPVYIADMVGDNIYETELPKNAILVMGNEANGISKEILDLAVHRISIPRFGEDQVTESLNVATATAILLSEFKRSFL